MRNKYIESFEKAQLENNNVPTFRAGDTVRVAVRIKEGEKTRVQNFEGLCIAIRGQGTGRTFMVRKMGANSVGVERIFPLYSESIESIEVLRRGRISKNFVESNLSFCFTAFSAKRALFRSVTYFM